MLPQDTKMNWLKESKMTTDIEMNDMAETSSCISPSAVISPRRP